MIRSGINIAGKKHGPHSLRASLASSMVNDGISYETVRKVLGHDSPNAIRHYARLDIQMLRNCALACPAPSGTLHLQITLKRNASSATAELLFHF